MGESNEKQKPLKNKAIEVIINKKDDIIEYFDSFNIKETYPNEKKSSCLNRDKPIIKKIYPDENDNELYIEIYNFPAFFRPENGLYIIVNEITIYLEIFFNVWREKPEIDKKFNSFIQSIIEVDINKFKELIKIDIQKNDLIKIKQGFEKIAGFFGIETIKEFYLGLSSIGGSALIGGILGLICSGLMISGAAIGVGCCIIIGVIGFLIWSKNEREKQKKKIENRKKNIKIFFDEIKNISFEKFLDKNIFVIAVEKNKDNKLIDVCAFPYSILELNQNCPLLGDNAAPDSNSQYYELLLKGIDFYLHKYQSKIYENCYDFSYYYFIEELKKDIEFLQKATTKEISETINNSKNYCSIITPMSSKTCKTKDISTSSDNNSINNIDDSFQLPDVPNNPIENITDDLKKKEKNILVES